MNEWSQKITFGIALIGAVLGVINTWKSIDRDRLKLRVRGYAAVMVTQGSAKTPPSVLAIDVVNLSSFPVTITQVGLWDKAAKEHHILISPPTTAGKSLPCRLEPRESLTAYSSPEIYVDEPKTKDIEIAYAYTACGTKRVGKCVPPTDTPSSR